MNIREEIEKAIGSISTLRVLGEMAKNPTKTYSKYALAKGTMLNERDVANALKKLIAIGWIEELSYGRIKAYKLNLNNEKVKAAMKFLREIGYI
ncbi:MAG: hypothetical protein NDF55_03340 [archaeon GB-1867-005]|nr:hypothetical protein [Candidatus Culexmicrobium cathedralense]